MVLARLMDDSAAFGFKDELFSDPEVRLRCARLATKCTELADAADRPTGLEEPRSDTDGTSLLSRIELLVDVLSEGPDILESSDRWMRQEESLRRQIGSDLAVLRGLDETVEYDVGAEPEYQSETSDLIVQASLSVAAPAWTQVLYLSDVAEDSVVGDRVRLGLRKDIAADLAPMAAAVDPGREAPAPLIGDTTDLWVPEDVSSEYERTIIARYVDVRVLISALLEGKASHGTLSGCVQPHRNFYPSSSKPKHRSPRASELTLIRKAFFGSGGTSRHDVG
jgi:hypothetical protein